MITKIQKIGNDLGIDIPKGLLEQLGWSDREEVSVVSVDGKLIIERSKNVKRKNIFELFEGFSGEYKPEKIGVKAESRTLSNIGTSW